MFKKGDTLVCVNNSRVNDDLTLNKQYPAMGDQCGGLVEIIDNGGLNRFADAYRFALAESHIELSAEPIRLSIELSILETCVQLLDEIRKPSVPSYHREHLRMAQQVIDSNTANAEIVQSYLKRCLPKSESVESPTESDQDK